MLNVAKGVFKSRLPVPLIKEIIILPSEVQQEQIKQFNIIVKVLLQTVRENYNRSFNLNVTAITTPQEESILSLNPDGIKSYVSSQSNLVKNVKINNLSKEGTLSYYNKTEDSRLYTKIIDVPMTIPSIGSLEYLSILCFTNSVDETEDTKTSGLTLTGNQIDVSRHVIEKVKTAGAISRTSLIYKLLDTIPGYGNVGDVWVGPVHMHPETGLMAEKVHVNSPHPRLEVFQVPNQKIKDYRTNIVNSIIKNRPRLSDAVEKYITAPEYSRSKDGSLKIHTNFSFLQYIRDEGALSYLFDNDTALLSTAELLDIKVYRNRSDTANYGNFLTSVQRLENQSISEHSPRRLVGTLSDGSVKLIQKNSEDLSLEVLPILIIDSQIKDELEGYYRYEIEIVINDNSAKIVSEMATKLQNKITEAQSYNLKFNNYGKRNYDVDANVVAREVQLKSDNSWKSALEEYASILQFMFGSQVGPIPVALLARNMFSFASPYSASEESLAEFNNILNTFVQILFETVSKTTGSIQKKQRFNSAIASAVPLVRKLKYVYDTKQNYFNSLTRNNGYDYLGPDVGVSDLGFSRISLNQFQNRIIEETEKYDVSSQNSLDINKFGYLSPSQIKTNTTNIKVEKQIDFNKSLDLLQANESPIGMSKNFKTNSDIKSGQADAAGDLLGLSGVMLAPKVLKLSNLRKAQIEVNSLDSSKFLSNTSGFTKENRDAETKVSGSKEIKFKQDSSQREKYVDSNLVQFMLQQKAADFKSVKAPNIVEISGSLAYVQVTKAPDSFESLNVLEKNINFNSVVKVEYSVGSGDNWEILNSEKFNDIKNSNTSVLCRITKPNDVLNVSNKFKLERYDQLFVLGDEDLNTRTSNISPDRLMDTIKKNVTKLFSSNLNNKLAGGAVMSQYLTSQAMSFERLAGRSTTDNASSSEGQAIIAAARSTNSRGY